MIDIKYICYVIRWFFSLYIYLFSHLSIKCLFHPCFIYSKLMYCLGPQIPLCSSHVCICSADVTMLTLLGVGRIMGMGYKGM